MRELSLILGYYQYIRMKGKRFLWVAVLLIFSCNRKVRTRDVYDVKFYIRITSPVDSSKNMYVVYNCIIDTSYKMFKFYWDNGKIQSISFFFKNKKTGPWIGYFDDGKISFEQNFIDGKKEGDYKVYFMNGQISVFGTYRNDYKTGIWNYYTKNGTLLKAENYK